MSKKLLRIAGFCRKHTSFTEAQIRWIRFCSKSGRKNSRGEPVKANGFASAFLMIGGSVFVDEDEFFRVVDEQNSDSAAA